MRSIIRVFAAAMWLTALPLTARAAPEGCEGRPATTSTVQQSLDLAQLAYNDLDDAGFKASLERALEALPCLEELIPRPLAASIHRYVGIGHFLERDHNRAQMAFAAAKSIEPNYRFPESLVPTDHPLFDDYDAPPPASPMFEAAPALSGGYYTFDGSPGSQRPTDRPTIAQVMRDDGAVAATAYLRPGYSLLRPEGMGPGTSAGSAPKAPAAAVARPTAPPEKSRKAVRIGVSAGLGTVAAVAGYLGYAQWDTASERARTYRAWSPPADFDPSVRAQVTAATRELEGLRDATNSAYWRSVASTAVAAAALAGSVTVAVAF
jgi:hypothetical protein